MNIRRRTLAGLVAALLVPGLVACDKDADGSGKAGNSDDPKAALIAATEAIAEGNFRFTFADHESTGEGTVHLPSRSAQLLIKNSAEDFSMEMEFILIEDESWMKLDLGGLMLPGFEGLSGDKYMHVDRSKIAEIEGLQIDADNVDPTGAEQLVEAIADVKKTGEGTYSGTIDLSKTTDVGFVDEAIVTALGEQAKAVQFEAKLDAEGRLSELTAKVPAAGDVKAHELKITYFDYGSATAPQKPAASDVVEAPATLYEMFQE